MKSRLGAATEGTLIASDAYLVTHLANDPYTGILGFAALFCAQNTLILTIDVMNKLGEARRQHGYKKSKLHRQVIKAREREILERQDKEYYDNNSPAD